MSIVGTEHIKLPHADAWGKSASPSSSRGPLTGINQNKNTDKARIVDLWSSASSELEAKQKREQERKYDVSILFYGRLLLTKLLCTILLERVFMSPAVKGARFLAEVRHDFFLFIYLFSLFFFCFLFHS